MLTEVSIKQMAELEAHILHSINYNIQVSLDQYEEAVSKLQALSQSYEETKSTSSGGETLKSFEERMGRTVDRSGRFGKKS